MIDWFNVSDVWCACNWKTQAAAYAEQQTLKAQIRRQQKHKKRSRSVHLLNGLASMPVAEILPGRLCHRKCINDAKFSFTFLLLTEVNQLFHKSRNSARLTFRIHTHQIYRNPNWSCILQPWSYMVFCCTKYHHYLRSSSQLLLYQPVARINFQCKAFSIAAPAVWNSLSSSTKSSTTTTSDHLQGTSENRTVRCCIWLSLTFLLPPAPPIRTFDIRHRL